jgi:tetratricopeptide (TPR) repeat protein
MSKSIPIYLCLSVFLIMLLSRCATPSILVTQEQNKGDELFNRHNYNEASRHYSLMLDASRKLGIYRNPLMEADVHRKIANCNEMTGNYVEAISHVRQAMSIDSAENNLAGKIEDFRQEGKILIYMGAFQKSISSLEKSLVLCEGFDQSIKGTNQLAIADTYLALGQLYSVLGLTEKAIGNATRAFNLFKKCDDQKGEMESYLVLGSVWSDLGDFINARKIIEQAIAIAKVLKVATARHNLLLASISNASGEYETALRYQEKALDEAKSLGISAQIIWATVGMGDIYRDLGDFNRAEKYYKSAREGKDTISLRSGSIEASLDLRMGEVLNAWDYFRSEGSLTGGGISALRMAEIYLRKDRPDSAKFFLKRALILFREIRNKQGIANAQLLAGKLAVDEGKPESAKQLLDSARMSDEFPEVLWQSWYYLGRMYENINLDENAIESYKNAISVIEKIRGNLTLSEFKSTYFESKREVYDRLIKILLKLNRNSDAFQVSEKARARAFYDILANKKINFKGSLPGDLISLEQEKRIEIQK